MGRKAYWVSMRQPGCRNILKRYKAPAFLRSGCGYKNWTGAKTSHILILYIITDKIVDNSIICYICTMKSFFHGTRFMNALNKVKLIRESRLMSKSELARKAGVSTLTVDRIERGEKCRMETMRKIILALGYSLEDKSKVFQDQE